MSNEMKRLLFVLLCTSSMCTAGTENNGRGAKSIGLGNAFVAVADNPWAVYYNPAGLASLQSFETSVFVIPQQFGLSQLRTISLAAAVPTNLGTFALGVSQFGFELYRETQVSLGIGETIDWGVSGGLTANLFHISLGDYGSTQSATVDIGLLAHFQEQVTLGFSYKNLLGATVGSQKDRLPQVFSFGTSYTPVNNFLLTLELEKDIRYPAIIKAGAEQTILDLLSIRAGVSNNPDKFSGGMAVRYSQFEFAYAGYSHPQLGWTHQLELTFQLGS